jgi:hypothetical protein
VAPLSKDIGPHPNLTSGRPLHPFTLPIVGVGRSIIAQQPVGPVVGVGGLPVRLDQVAVVVVGEGIHTIASELVQGVGGVVGCVGGEPSRVTTFWVRLPAGMVGIVVSTEGGAADVHAGVVVSGDAISFATRPRS